MMKNLLVPVMLAALVAPASVAAGLGGADTVTGNLCLMGPAVERDVVQTVFFYGDAAVCSVSFVSADTAATYGPSPYCRAVECGPAGPVFVTLRGSVATPGELPVPTGVRVAEPAHWDLLP